jgi:4-coumarate--CoA ligase
MPAFNLPEFCKTVEKEKIIVVYIVPPVALALAKVPIVDEFNLRSLRFLHSSAAPTPKELIVAVRNRLETDFAFVALSRICLPNS